MTEAWLPIAGFEGRYEVSDQGRVRALYEVYNQAPAPRIIGDRIKATGRMPYWQVTLCAEDGHRRHALIHQLVLETFVGPAPEGMECRHLDGDTDRNMLSNLRWGTRQENIKDQARHGSRAYGERHGSAKLTENDVREIRRLASTGMAQHRIGTQFGVGQMTVSRAVRGETWPHVTPTVVAS